MLNDSNRTVGGDMYVDRTGDAPVTGRTSLQGDMEEFLEEHIEENPGESESYRILDIGCGGAGYHPALEDALEESFPELDVEVIGVDLNTETLRDVKNGRFMYSSSEIRDSETGEYFQTHVPMMQGFHASGLELVGGDGFRLPFQDGSVDAVVSQYLKTHYEEDGLVDEARRVTGDDGFVGFWDEKEREVQVYDPSAR